MTELRRLHKPDDSLALVVNDLDGLDVFRYATSSRATAANYSGKLAAQGRVHALGKARANGPAASFTGG
jgi:hypothetical protein